MSHFGLRVIVSPTRRELLIQPCDYQYPTLCTKYHGNKGKLIPCATAHGMSLVSRNYDHQISTHASTHFSQVRCYTERMIKPDKHAVGRWFVGFGATLCATPSSSEAGGGRWDTNSIDTQRQQVTSVQINIYLDDQVLLCIILASLLKTARLWRSSHKNKASIDPSRRTYSHAKLRVGAGHI